ncbi:hypothetical protein Cgig2_004354 [Carnegiea gigantea]|uniref:Uncharacterized protein n=1 Tax=Carnegiea gigantea TaxID=171969 RepID=A0A9Q1GKP4_9CARY|nr:hypothetical protein Cgig2_004354 [Carnegiea gigantea]
MVLGYIYHGLREATTNAIFPSHSVIGWSAELFPCLYHHRLDSNCPGDFPTLVRHAGLLGSKLSLPQARHVFRGGRYLSLRASSCREDSRNGRDVIDTGLPDQDFKFLLSIQSSILPSPSIANEHNDLAQAHADLQKRDTWAKFYVPPSYYEDLLANRARVSQSLSALHSMISIYKLSTIEICWLSSKIKEIYGVVKTAAKIKELVDVDQVKAFLGAGDFEGGEADLQNVRGFDHPTTKQSKLKSFLDSKNKEAKQNLEKEKDRFKNFIGFVISFNNV